jgi:hypothetical protein
MPDNPFEVLQLSPEASEQDAVRQAARQCQRASDEPARNAARQAIQRLTASREEWTLCAMLTHPRPEHQDAEIERFVAAHRRPPATAGAAPGVPGVDLEELRGLLLDALAEEQAVGPLALERLPLVESAEEIGRQTSEALWQGLIAELRG